MQNLSGFNLTKKKRLHNAALLLILPMVAYPVNAAPETQRPNAAKIGTKTLNTKSWIGKYKYLEKLGRLKTTGEAAVIEHVLTVEPKGDKLVANLRSQGIDTDESLKGDVKIDQNKLILLFKCYSDGSTVNELGVDMYDVGAPLLTLEKRNSAGKEIILTTWQGFKLINDKAPNGQVYFEPESSSKVGK